VIVYAAIDRLVSPHAVKAWPIIIVAIAGIVVNGAATMVLAGGARKSLNIEGSFQHLLTDLYAFIGTLIAGVIILTTGYVRVDAIASLIVAGLMLRSGIGLVRASARVFLEASPAGLSPADVGNALAHEPGVVEVHDLHIWEVTSGFPALSAHVLVATDADCHATRRGLERMLDERFDLHHTTLQVDHEPRELIELEVAPAARRAPDA
jgi:cobalt-zinc-cadmium efflux system protein